MNSFAASGVQASTRRMSRARSAAFDYKSSTPLELAAILKDQLRVWGTVAREAGLQPH